MESSEVHSGLSHSCPFTWIIIGNVFQFLLTLLHSAAKMILLKHNSQHVNSPTENSPVASHITQKKTKVLKMACKALSVHPCLCAPNVPLEYKLQK